MTHTSQHTTIINPNQQIQKQWVNQVIMLLIKQQEVSSDKVKLKMLPEEMEVVEEINLVTALMNLWPTEETWIKEAHT